MSLESSHEQTFTFKNLQNQLEAELAKNNEAQKRIQELESEAECAVAWAQTASETVNVLESQLDAVEKELEETMTELRKYKSQESPMKSKDNAVMSMFQKLQDSQTREAEMFQQAEDMQRELLEVHEKLSEKQTACSQYETEIKNLREDLSAALQRETHLVSQCKSTTSLWDTYNQVRGEMDRTLTSHLTAATNKKQNGMKDGNGSLDAYRLEEEVHELEMMLAQADTNLIEERNKTAKLEDENATLHKYILQLQAQCSSENLAS